jgi:nucleotide-binding universal stress UspA family protein
MPSLLIAIDGSRYSDHAVDYAIRRAGASREAIRVHLLNVQLPIVGVNVKLFISQDSLESYYHDEATAVLEAPRRKLKAAGLQCEHHIGVGDPGQVIVDYARATACDEIIMGTHGRGFLSGAIMGSVAQKVAQLAAVPVVLVKNG